MWNHLNKTAQVLTGRIPLWGGGTMGHFRESSYAYLMFKNGTILTIITSNTYIHKGKATTATIDGKKKSTYLCLLHLKGKVSPVLEGLVTSLWGQIGVEFSFQSTGTDYRHGGLISTAH